MQRFFLTLASIAIIGLHVFLAARWHQNESTPPPWDPAVHFDTAADYKEAIQNRSLAGLLFAAPRPGHPPYPPLYHLSLIPFLNAERPDIAVVWVNLFYLALLCASTAWVALRLGGPVAALASAAAVSLSPEILQLHRTAFPDLAMTALVASAYAAGISSNGFSKDRLAAAASVLTALAMLSKWSAFVYLIPLYGYGLLWGERRKTLYAAAAAALLCAPWYALNLPFVVPRVLNSMSLGAGEGDPNLWTLSNWLWYPRFIARAFGRPTAFLMLAGLLRALWLKSKDGSLLRERRVAAAWLLFSYAAWSLVSNKDTRYILPAAAALPALGLSALPAPASLLGLTLAAFNARTLPRPSGESWPFAEILSETAALTPGKTGLCILVNYPQMNTTSARWIARHAGHDLRIGCTQGRIPEFSDAVLLKTGDPGPYLNDSTLRVLEDAAENRAPFSAAFETKKEWPLPDGSRAVLYGHKKTLPLIRRTRRWDGLRVRSALLEGILLEPDGENAYRVSISTLTLDKIAAPVRQLRLRLSGAQIAEIQGKPYVLALKNISLDSGGLDWSELSSALAVRSKLPVKLAFSNGAIAARVGQGFFSIRLEIKPELFGSTARARLNSLHLGPLPIPHFGLIRVERRLDAPNPNQPFSITATGLRLDENGLNLEAPR